MLATRERPREKLDFLTEVAKCRRDFAYFAGRYCMILSEATQGGAADWVPFRLWPGQVEVARKLQSDRLLVILKARQLGLSWLVVAFALWLMLFHPIATVLLFSKRDDEAMELLKIRLRGMYARLPAWLQVRGFTVDSGHEWGLSNGSRVKAFPCTGGRSYTATMVLVDEADFVPDLQSLLNAVKPAIDAGGRLILVSTADKAQPESLFKRIFRAAAARENAYTPVFLDWSSRPGRDAAWYEAQKRDVLANTGALDNLHQEYPATAAEALAPRSLDKRIPAEWLLQCYREERPRHVAGAPAIPGLEIFRIPEPERQYQIGIDPAEGNPTSDDSALAVVDSLTGEECAVLAGKFQPAVMAGHADEVGRWYNNAALMVERNNHGHAVLLWLADHSKLKVLCGLDGHPGWLSNAKGKTLLYSGCADAFREKQVILHSAKTFHQLASIEGSTLRAPDGQHDDRADSFALALPRVEAEWFVPGYLTD